MAQNGRRVTQRGRLPRHGERVTVSDRLLRRFEDSFATFGHERDMPSDFETAGLATEDAQVAEWGTRRGIFRTYTGGVDRESASDVRAVLAVLSLHVERLESRFEYEEVDELHRALHAAALCYFGGEIREDTSECPGFYGSPAGRWARDCFRLFISHVSSDRRWVTELAELLEQEFGISGFVAHVSIVHSLEWQREIEREFTVIANDKASMCLSRLN